MRELARRDLFKTAGATAAGIGAISLAGPGRVLFGGQARAAGGAAWNHDPRSPIGPLHWSTIGYPVCGAGMAQSPVDIRTDRLGMYHGSAPLLRYQRSQVRVGNTGHYVVVPIPAGTHDALHIGDDVYPLVQYHFHVPAEHAVNGRLPDLEAHFVHTDSHGDAAAAVGVFFSIGPNPNPLLDSILLAAPPTAGEEVGLGESASPAELLENISGVSRAPDGATTVESFYSYDGSLTTPGCAEGLLWSVLVGGGQVSRAAVTRFHDLIARFPYYNGYPNNNRPLQPLGDRIIRLRHGRGFD